MRSLPMLKLIASRSLAVLAVRTAARSVPGPESSALVTTIVASRLRPSKGSTASGNRLARMFGVGRRRLNRRDQRDDMGSSSKIAMTVDRNLADSHCRRCRSQSLVRACILLNRRTPGNSIIEVLGSATMTLRTFPCPAFCCSRLAWLVWQPLAPSVPIASAFPWAGTRTGIITTVITMAIITMATVTAALPSASACGRLRRRGMCTSPRRRWCTMCSRGNPAAGDCPTPAGSQLRRGDGHPPTMWPATACRLHRRGPRRQVRRWSFAIPPARACLWHSWSMTRAKSSATARPAVTRRIARR